jgi:hypothetical protein
VKFLKFFNLDNCFFFFYYISLQSNMFNMKKISFIICGKKFDVLNLKTSMEITTIVKYLELAVLIFQCQITIGHQNGLEMSKFILNLQIGMCIITKRSLRKRNSSCSMGTRLGNFEKQYRDSCFRT